MREPFRTAEFSLIESRDDTDWGPYEESIGSSDSQRRVAVLIDDGGHSRPWDDNEDTQNARTLLDQVFAAPIQCLKSDIFAPDSELQREFHTRAAHSNVISEPWHPASLLPSRVRDRVSSVVGVQALEDLGLSGEQSPASPWAETSYTATL